MNNKATGSTTLPRRKWAYDPRLLVLMGLLGSLYLGLGAFVYLAVLGIPGMSHPAGVNPMIAVGIGLLGGFTCVAVQGRFLRRQLEAEARALAFGELPWKSRLLQVSVFIAIVVVTFGALYLAAGRTGGLAVLLTLGSLFAPSVFLYHSYARVRIRARELLIEAAQGPQAPTTPSSPRPSKAGRWVNAFGLISVASALALGAWLQWAVPWMAQREPRHFETKTDDTYGVATRLTYGNDASAPAVSPDGRLVAYVRNVWLWNGRLQIMRTDGHGKRRLGEEQALSPAGFYPLRWSSDGKRILLVGDRVPAPKTWDDTLKEGKSFSYDLWTVDVASGAARRLTDDDGYLAGIWLPAARKIGAIRSAGRGKWARLWLMDERAGNWLKVANLKLRRHSLAAQPWHDGRDVVVVGTDESEGIWSVDARDGLATRLSDIPARWALPLAPQWLVIAVNGRAYPPFDRATSIGIFDAATRKVHWALRDIQGTVEHPRLVRKLGVVIFTLWLDEGYDVWALRLRDGQLRRLTRSQSVMNVAVDPLGKTIFYQARNEERERFLGFNIGYSIWRLTPGRPLAFWQWNIWPLMSLFSAFDRRRTRRKVRPSRGPCAVTPDAAEDYATLARDRGGLTSPATPRAGPRPGRTSRRVRRRPLPLPPPRAGRPRAPRPCSPRT
jgi:hypothetical protein